MNDHGPSSVTIEEAVAKMIGFEVLPENITLLEALEYMLQSSEFDFFNAQENGSDSDTIKQFGKEFTEWRKSLCKAKDLFEDIENSIQNDDPLLVILPTDTCKVRLATQSVYEWSKRHFGIEIPEWKEFRGAVSGSSKKIDEAELEGQQLFESILCLTDNLLIRAWPNWNRRTPNLSRQEIPKYFLKKRPNISAISRDIEQQLDFTETLKAAKAARADKAGKESKTSEVSEDSDTTKKQPSRTISNHIKYVVEVLSDPSNQADRLFSSDQLSKAYETLVGLYRLLETRSKSGLNPKIDSYKVEELELVRFAQNLQTTSCHIRERELIDCLARALRIARERKL